MKASTLTAKLLSLVALMLVVVMAFSACGKTKGNESDSANADVTSAEGNTEDTSSTEDANDASSKKKDGSSKSKNTTSKSKNTTSKKTGNNDSTSPVNLTDYANIPASVKEKGIHVLMWRKYTESEQKQINDFQSKTGIKVRTTVTTEKEYSTKLIAMIAGKDSPDVVCMSASNFPGFITKSLQPLDVNKFNLNDSAWYKKYMDVYRVGDKYFGAAMRGIWSVEDCNYVTYYNPDVLRECGITQMPYDLYKAGNWNWAEQKKIALAIANAGKAKGYIGLSMQGFDVFMHSAGLDFVDYDPVKATFTNNIGANNDKLVAAWTEAAELNAAEATSAYEINGFRQGKVGMLSGIAYGLYSNGNWFDTKNDTLYKTAQAVPVAGPTQSTAYIPVRPKAWGVPKGSNNVQGAAYFIRYFLDPTTIDMNSTFYNDQYKEVYNIIIAENAKKHIMRGEGIADYTSNGNYSKICKELNKATAANINTVLDRNKGTINTGVTRANKDLVRVTSK